MMNELTAIACTAQPMPRYKLMWPSMQMLVLARLRFIPCHNRKLLLCHSQTTLYVAVFRCGVASRGCAGR